MLTLFGIPIEHWVHNTHALPRRATYRLIWLNKKHFLSSRTTTQTGMSRVNSKPYVCVSHLFGLKRRREKNTKQKNENKRHSLEHNF